MNFLISLSLVLVALTGTLHADCCCDNTEDYSFYVKAGSGISFSESADVYAPPLTWNPAIQGYNAKLGNQAIAELSIGCEFIDLVDVEVGISCRSAFKYRKFQTPISGGSSYTRKFDLSVIPILFSFQLLGKDIPYLNWDIACGKIYPIIGAGIGVSNLLISNFRTTGLLPSGASDPYASFSSENQFTLRQNFTYTARIGVEYVQSDRWAIATGYRFFDAGKFRGPRYQRVSSGAAVDVADEAWKMRFRANEWFIEFKIIL